MCVYASYNPSLHPRTSLYRTHVSHLLPSFHRPAVVATVSQSSPSSSCSGSGLMCLASSDLLSDGQMLMLSDASLLLAIDRTQFVVYPFPLASASSLSILDREPLPTYTSG